MYIWIYVNIYPTRESKNKNKSRNQFFKLLMWKHWLLKYFVISRDSVILTSMSLDHERKPKCLKRTHKHGVPAENLRSMRLWFLNSSANNKKIHSSPRIHFNFNFKGEICSFFFQFVELQLCTRATVCYEVCLWRNAR